ncbi:MAG: DUF4091 domain-containing protein [Candidatus Electrothrix sp. GM3_4]|nr:DUF4091 domain-containing protein [Candidatus Electrothrix sp. GM3_4]
MSFFEKVCCNLVVAVFVCLFPLPAESAFSGDVWSLSGTVRLLRNAPAGSGSSVSIAAARDEWESFQVFVHADTSVTVTDVTSSDLSGPSGYIISGEDIRLFREHYFQITQATYKNAEFVSGWYPDALIPFTLPTTVGQMVPAKYTAVPFELPAGQTHGFLVDVHVPGDAPAGDYTGTISVHSDSGSSDISVMLTVWDFTLPRVATLKTVFMWPPNRMMSEFYTDGYNEPTPTDVDGMEAQSVDLFSRHRICSWMPPGLRWWMKPQEQDDGSWIFEDGSVKKLQDFADSHHINNYRIRPQRIFDDPNDPRFIKYLQAYDSFLEEADRPDVQFFVYVDDEPNNKADYQKVRDWGSVIVENSAHVKALVTEQTTPQDPDWGNLYGAVDIWTQLFSLFDATSAAARRTLGEDIWAYTALSQGPTTMPWWHTDRPLLNYRATTWIAWNNHMTGLLSWDSAYWDKKTDPWTNPSSYINSSGEIFNGEACLVYPGRAVGYDGITSSIRFKVLRDAIEDYEYMAILERMGKRSQAAAVVSNLVTDFENWDRTASNYEDARVKLAELIVADATIEEVRVASSMDDVEERIDGSMYTDSSDLELVDDSSNQTVGMRFTGINIPAGVTIQNAYIQFKCDETSTVSTNLTIHVQDTDNAEAFSTSSHDVSSRATTSASASWAPAAWNTVSEAGPNQRTPELKALLQEVVDRDGWHSGNDIVIIMTGSGTRTAEAYDGDNTGAALLHVEYSTGTPSKTAPVILLLRQVQQFPDSQETPQ